ncbi:MAG: hypothetical protein ABIV39_13345 [Verrucomicrobiota bacterium]
MKIFSHSGKKNALRAFAVMDVVISVAVLGIVLSSLFACFSFGFRVVSSSREELQASQVLNEKMETIRLYNWDQLNQTNFLPSKFNAAFGNSTSFFKGTVLVTNVSLAESYTADLRMVTVSLSWTNNSSKRTRFLNTYVSRYGLQGYIFQ